MKTKTVFGVSVARGRFRDNRVEYGAGGRSRVTPLCDWTTRENAERIVAKAKAEGVAA